MVYIRRTIVKGNLYYELVRCKRDVNGVPKQEHLKYLGKNLINKKDIELFEKDFKGYDLKSKNLTRIIHSIMKSNHGLLDLELLYKKTQNQGFNKKLVDDFIFEHLNKKKFIRIELQQSQIRNDLPPRTINLINQIATERKFLKDTLEKVVRLNLILKEVSKNKFLQENLVFFGGTAINSIYQNYDRLSVDIDLQVTSNNPTIRTKIKEEIRKILNQQKYSFEEKSYELDQFIIKFETSHGRHDIIKLEINNLDIQTILPPVPGKVKSPINDPEFNINTLVKEELYAKKISALLDRSVTRDLYDVFKFENYDKKIVRKCLIANYLLREKNIIKLEKSFVFKPSIQDYNNYLKPVISQSENLSLDEMHKKVNEKVTNITKSITTKELEFAQNFNPKEPHFEKLFNKIQINNKLHESPLLKK